MGEAITPNSGSAQPYYLRLDTQHKGRGVYFGVFLPSPSYEFICKNHNL